MVHVEPHLKTNLSLSIQPRWSEQEFHSWSNGGTIYRVSQYEYIFVPDQAEKEDAERKRITFQSITFLAPLLAEMILFSWLSIKDIILLDRRLVAFPFFLSFFFFFFSYFCNICLLVSAD